MEIEINDDNKEEVLGALKEQGYSIRTQDEEQSFLKNRDDMVAKATKELYSKMDQDILNSTGIKKLTFEDGKSEKTYDYFKRATESALNEKKEASNQVNELNKKLESLNAELEGLRSEGGDKYQTQIKELVNKHNSTLEEKEAAIKKLEETHHSQLKEIRVKSVTDALRPMFEKDLKAIDDIVAAKQSKLMSMEFEIKEDGTEVIKLDGVEQINEKDGSYKSWLDIAKETFSDVLQEPTSTKEGAGIKGSKPNESNHPNFSNRKEASEYLDEKGLTVGSPDWLKAMQEIRQSNPDLF